MNESPRDHKRPSLLLIGLLIGSGLALIVWFGFGPGRDSLLRLLGRNTISMIAPVQGKPAPDFTLSTISGEQVKLSDLKGKTVLLNFWATWCTPCKLEMPLLQSYSQEHESDLEILAVNFDESESDVRKFIDELGLTFPVLLDPGGNVQREFQVRGYPTSVFIDAQGNLQYQHAGILSKSQIDRYLQKMQEGNP